MIDYDHYAIPERPTEKPTEGEPRHPEADVSTYNVDVCQLMRNRVALTIERTIR